MPRLKKRFDNPLLTQIRNAVYFGGANYEIAARLGIDRKTWYHWRKNEAVQRAIEQGQKKRWKRNIQQMGWNHAAVEADFARLSEELNILETDHRLETFSENGYLFVVETKKTGNRITRSVTKTPELVPIEELMTKDNL